MMETGGWEKASNPMRTLLREEVDSALECAEPEEKGKLVMMVFEMGALGGPIDDDSPMDMTDADLRRTDLRDKSLPGIELSGANLSGANFGGADLDGDEPGIIYPADFRDVVGVGLHLQGADARGIRLEGANLRGAVLCRAALSRAVLDGSTDLSDAEVSEDQLDVSGVPENRRPSVGCAWPPGEHNVPQQVRTEESSVGVKEGSRALGLDDSSTGELLRPINCTKQLQHVRSIFYTDTRSATIEEMVENLLRSNVDGDVECAHRLANSVFYSQRKSAVLESVSLKYVDLEQCERAVEVAKDIPYTTLRDAQLRRILLHRNCRRL